MIHQNGLLYHTITAATRVNQLNGRIWKRRSSMLTVFDLVEDRAQQKVFILRCIANRLHRQIKRLNRSEVAGTHC